MESMHFKRFEGGCFELLTSDSSRISLKLIELNEHPKQDLPGIRESPFSLLFQGPGEPILPALRYALKKPDETVIELFLQAVVGSDPNSVYYEAVFN